MIEDLTTILIPKILNSEIILHTLVSNDKKVWISEEKKNGFRRKFQEENKNYIAG